MMLRRKPFGIAALLLALLVMALVSLPYRAFLEDKLKAQLAEAGMERLNFRVSEVSLKSVTLADVSLDGQALESLTLGYSPLEIMQGNFRSLDAREIALKQGNMKAALNAVTLSIAPNASKEHWEGPWEIGDIRLEGVPLLVPALSAKGMLRRDADTIYLSGGVRSEDGLFLVTFIFNYVVADKDKSVLTVSYAQLPWNGGMVSVKRVKVPVFGTSPIRFTVQAQGISLDTLLSAATDRKASATGKISGSIPLTVQRDGNFTVHAGQMKAESAGTLTLSPELLPGDNEQMQLVRDALKGFQYEVFSLQVENADAKQLSMLLSLRGNNPEVYNGREIHLNVHLTGNVIELLTQSLMMLNDPQQLLEQHDAK
ncbi:MAG: YdbH domain-containing protein [Rickettsiales bacterium]|nr:YdbH domain-containing protein [Rickettsiales bacterium]